MSSSDLLGFRFGAVLACGCLAQSFDLFGHRDLDDLSRAPCASTFISSAPPGTTVLRMVLSLKKKFHVSEAFEFS